MELLDRLKKIRKPAEITDELLRTIVDYIERRKWETEKFPDVETEVLIIVEHRPFRRKPHRRVCRAIYEDGLQRAEDSVFFWDTDGPMVPEGWYETADYGSSNMVDDIVIGWQPLPDPWET